MDEGFTIKWDDEDEKKFEDDDDDDNQIEMKVDKNLPSKDAEEPELKGIACLQLTCFEDVEFKKFKKFILFYCRWSIRHYGSTAKICCLSENSYGGVVYISNWF